MKDEWKSKRANRTLLDEFTQIMCKLWLIKTLVFEIISISTRLIVEIITLIYWLLNILRDDVDVLIKMKPFHWNTNILTNKILPDHCCTSITFICTLTGIIDASYPPFDCIDFWRLCKWIPRLLVSEPRWPRCTKLLGLPIMVRSILNLLFLRGSLFWSSKQQQEKNCTQNSFILLWWRSV